MYEAETRHQEVTECSSFAVYSSARSESVSVPVKLKLSVGPERVGNGR